VICAHVQQVFGDHKALGDALVLGLSGACFAGAWRWRARPLAVILVVLGGLVLGLGMALDDYLHPWDERYHALVARNLGAHPLVPTLFDEPTGASPGAWKRAHVWLHKPPLAPWLMAGTLELLGPCELAVRLPSLLLFAAATWATFRIGAELFDRRVGLVAAGLYAIHGRLLDLASGRVATDHPDSVLASLVALGALAALVQVRRNSRVLALLVGVLAGLGVLTKWLPGLLVLGLWGVAMPWRERPRRCALDLGLGAMVCAALTVPWSLYVRSAFPVEARVEAAYAWRHLWHPLEGHGGGPLWHVARLPRYFGEASPLAIAWFLARRARQQPFVTAWLVVPYAVFSLAATKMEGYVMIAAPAVLLMVAAALVALIEKRTLLRGALAAALVVLPVRFTLERYKPFEVRQVERERAARLRALDADPAYPIESMFYGATPAGIREAGAGLRHAPAGERPPH
jgi:4-amino-4-deoxy-L-arabinose transferase